MSFVRFFVGDVSVEVTALARGTYEVTVGGNETISSWKPRFVRGIIKTALKKRGLESSDQDLIIPVYDPEFEAYNSEPHSMVLLVVPKVGGLNVRIGPDGEFWKGKARLNVVSENPLSSLENLVAFAPLRSDGWSFENEADNQYTKDVAIDLLSAPLQLAVRALLSGGTEGAQLNPNVPAYLADMVREEYDAAVRFEHTRQGTEPVPTDSLYTGIFAGLRSPQSAGADSRAAAPAFSSIMPLLAASIMGHEPSEESTLGLFSKKNSDDGLRAIGAAMLASTPGERGRTNLGDLLNGMRRQYHADGVDPHWEDDDVPQFLFDMNDPMLTGLPATGGLAPDVSDLQRSREEFVSSYFADGHDDLWQEAEDEYFWTELEEENREHFVEGMRQDGVPEHEIPMYLASIGGLVDLIVLGPDMLDEVHVCPHRPTSTDVAELQQLLHDANHLVELFRSIGESLVQIGNELLQENAGLVRRLQEESERADAAELKAKGLATALKNRDKKSRARKVALVAAAEREAALEEELAFFRARFSDTAYRDHQRKAE